LVRQAEWKARALAALAGATVVRRANAATLYSPRAATKWWAGPQGS
jgi:hypothetical protein